MAVWTRIAQHVHWQRQTFSEINKNWLVSITSKLIVVFFVLSILIIAWRWSLLPPQVPLWYSKPWGDDRLAHPFWLFLLPLGSLFWYSIGVIVSIYLTSTLLVFTQLVFLTSLVVSALSFTTLAKILFLIT